MLQRIARQNMVSFGHVMRADGLEKEMMLACGEERRRREWPRKSWMEKILTGTWMGLEELKEVVRNCSEWRTLTMTVARIQGDRVYGKLTSSLPPSLGCRFFCVCKYVLNDRDFML